MVMKEIFLMSALNRSDDRSKKKMKQLISDIWKIVLKKRLNMEIRDTGIITITEKA